MNRRFLALFLILALCVALFVGCDAPEGESSSGTSTYITYYWTRE